MNPWLGLEKSANGYHGYLLLAPLDNRSFQEDQWEDLAPQAELAGEKLLDEAGTPEPENISYWSGVPFNILVSSKWCLISLGVFKACRNV